MIVRLGAETGKAGTIKADRMYGLLFKSLVFDVPIPGKHLLTWLLLSSMEYESMRV